MIARWYTEPASDQIQLTTDRMRTYSFHDASVQVRYVGQRLSVPMVNRPESGADVNQRCYLYTRPVSTIGCGPERVLTKAAETMVSSMPHFCFRPNLTQNRTPSDRTAQEKNSAVAHVSQLPRLPAMSTEAARSVFNEDCLVSFFRLATEEERQVLSTMRG